MYENEILGLFPERRIKAFDGMAVTADVWDSAHEYHRNLLDLHTRFAHGPGILYGLEVIAGEPPGSSVYVRPGIAIDPLGRTIVLKKPEGYDLRHMEGIVYIILSHSESLPRADGTRDDDAPRFVFSSYAIEAVTMLPQTPYIELGRVRRSQGVVTNAANADLPGLNEIDQRQRVQVNQAEPTPAIVSVVNLAGRDTGHAAGVAFLARQINQSGMRRVVVEGEAQLSPTILNSTIIYLVGQEPFRLPQDQLGTLYEFYRQGGTIFYESCRNGLTSEPAGDASFGELIQAMGLTLSPAPEGHLLMRDPYLFATPPDGYETQSGSRLLITDGVVFSSFDYGCIWRGQRRGRPAGRSEIRNAMEFGENLVALAQRRKRGL
ncbi:MAG: DUF4159 domain-containing protein [Caldilineaceae bacterium]